MEPADERLLSLSSQSPAPVSPAPRGLALARLDKHIR
uniref:Uncharacterized protein n=1 Tax=Anguilla anguilla TaxID=7936 RepID=A0A0E9TGF5_ANGAN